jgi:hypothetical protein
MGRWTRRSVCGGAFGGLFGGVRCVNIWVKWVEIPFFCFTSSEPCSFFIDILAVVWGGSLGVGDV